MIIEKDLGKHPRSFLMHFFVHCAEFRTFASLGEPYFICSSCLRIIRRTISPPIEPASREVRSPL